VIKTEGVDDAQDVAAGVEHGQQLLADPSLLEAVSGSIQRSLNSTANATALSVTTDKPNMLYFGIGASAFLLACALMIGYTQRLGFRQVAGDVVLFENPQDAPEDAHELSQDRRRVVTHPGDQIQFRMQQVLISWIFIVASIVYFMDYLASQASLPKVRHWFSAVASLSWLLGFLLHLHWQHSVGSNRYQQFSSHLKIWACVFQQVHPFSMIVGCTESDPGVWWPTLVGIALWHAGNVVAVTDFAVHPPLGFNRRSSPVSHANIPVTEMWVDKFATWLLLAAAICTTEWNGRPEAQLIPSNRWIVVVCEFGGATLFLLSSVLRCEWCNGFRNCSHQGA
jgi:hypothetical protein